MQPITAVSTWLATLVVSCALALALEWLCLRGLFSALRCATRRADAARKRHAPPASDADSCWQWGIGSGF